MTMYVAKLLALAIACWVAPLSAQQIAVAVSPAPAKSDCPYANARHSQASGSESTTLPVDRSRSEMFGVSRPGAGLLP
ncbi:MAG TPA: hypothetical protein VFS69_03705 [Sphingomicrobium sp.]|nr:hypothetical protein [Sphingomicrobium sp.]